MVDCRKKESSTKGVSDRHPPPSNMAARGIKTFIYFDLNSFPSEYYAFDIVIWLKCQLVYSCDELITQVVFGLWSRVVLVSKGLFTHALYLIFIT